LLRGKIPGVTLRTLMLLFAPGLCLGPLVASQDHAQAANDFESRVAKYLELRKKEAGSAPRPTNSPEKLADKQQDLAAKARGSRPDAKQGDIFAPEIADYFRHQIFSALAGHHGRKIRASLRHAEPVADLTLQVNQVYPQGIPRQSMPPTLLAKLPKLPKELEYRIVGRNLLLLDTAPGLLVDFVPNAIPSAKD
jgi:hypothetical protein